MNKTTLTSTLVILSLSLFAFASDARADDADKAACADLLDGDECVRGDGDEGSCVPDESNPGVLTCEDGPLGGTEDSAGSGSDNTAACVDLELGDSCLRDDGDEGTCVPDDSDPGVLECEDDAASSGSDDMPNGGGDKLACADLEAGDACEREDGDEGSCMPDDSDPGVLECEDGPSDSSSDPSIDSDNDVNLSCSVGDGSSPLGTMSVLMLFGLGAARRRMNA